MRIVAAFTLATVLYLPAQDPRERANEDLKKFGRGEGRLKPGDPAAGFTLKKHRSEQTVSLASYKGNKPVALVFGSFT
jgi:hypothetical protein